MRFDVFNGDADGICALHQLRLADPAQAILVSGVKRDIALLRHVQGERGDRVTVLDVSAHANARYLRSLVRQRVHVDYFDHHFPGDLPVSPYLQAHIDTSPGTCTSLIVDAHLHGAHGAWAVVGAFGDNLLDAAHARAAALGLRDDEVAHLRELGDDLSYNAYGEDERDLPIHPIALYRALKPYADPFAFIAEAPLRRRLAQQKQADLGNVGNLRPHLALPGAALHLLPDEAWARRARGLVANRLANDAPHMAHAVLAMDRRGGYVVSLRAPVASPCGADAVCRQFATGGGRAAAAGINHLPRRDLGRFADAVGAAWPSPVTGASARERGTRPSRTTS